MSVEQATARLSALQQEQATLRQAVQDLERQQREAESRLEGLLAAAERTPTAATSKAADAASSAVQELADQLRRKRAALSAATSELVAARADVQTARRLAMCERLQAVYEETARIAGELDRNLLQPDLWRRLVELRIEGNRLYSQVAQGQHTAALGRLFVDPGDARERVFAAWAQVIDRAMGRPVDKSPKTSATVGEALELARVQRVLQALHREMTSPAPLPAAAGR